MQDAPNAVRSIPYVSVEFFPSLKQNFIAYCSSSRSDCIFEIHQLWQSGFSRVYSNYCCSCSFDPEIIKIGQSSHKMYSNNILNFQESTTIFKCLYKKSGNLSMHHVNSNNRYQMVKMPLLFVCINIYIYQPSISMYSSNPSPTFSRWHNVNFMRS